MDLVCGGGDGMSFAAVFIDEHVVARCLVALGSNVGNRAELLDQAVASLSATADVRVHATSTYHVTSPVGGPPGQADFLNAAVCCETALSPLDLLHELQRIENELGRTRTQRWGARTLDLDLLLYDELVIETPELIVPHPHMSFRRFVLGPAAEVAGQMHHPTTGCRIQQLLDRLDHGPCYVALTGGQPEFRRVLVQDAAASLGCRCVSDPAPVVCEASPEASGGENPADRWLHLMPQRVAALTESGIGFGRLHASAYVLSDFWLGDWGVRAPLQFSQADRARIDEAWSAIPDAYRRPKLLVVVDAPPGLLTSAEGADAGVVPTSPSERTPSCTTRGPLLRVKSTSPASATAELIAAVLAMH